MGARWRCTVYPVLLILSLNNFCVFCQNLATFGPLSPALLNNEVNRVDANFADEDFYNSLLALAAANGILPELLGPALPYQQQGFLQDGPRNFLPIGYENVNSEVQLPGLLNPNIILPTPNLPPLSNEFIPPPFVTPPQTPYIFPQSLLPPPIPSPTLPLPLAAPSSPFGIVRPIVRNQKKVASCSTPSESITSEVNTAVSNSVSNSAGSVKSLALSQVQSANIAPSDERTLTFSQQQLNSQAVVNCPKLLPQESLTPKSPLIPQQGPLSNCPIFPPAQLNSLLTKPLLPLTKPFTVQPQVSSPQTSECATSLLQKPVINPISSTQQQAVNTLTAECPLYQPLQSLINCQDNIRSFPQPQQASFDSQVSCPATQASQTFLNPFLTGKIQQPPPQETQICQSSPPIPLPKPLARNPTIVNEKLMNTLTTVNYNPPTAIQQFVNPLILQNYPLNSVNCPQLAPEPIVNTVSSKSSAFIPQQLSQEPIANTVTTAKSSAIIENYRKVPQFPLFPPRIQAPILNLQSTATSQSTISEQNYANNQITPQLLPQFLEANPFLPSQQFAYPQTMVNSLATAASNAGQSLPIDPFIGLPGPYPVLSGPPLGFNPVGSNFLPFNSYIPPTPLFIPYVNPYDNVLLEATSTNEANLLNVQDASTSIVLPEENFGNIEVTNIVQSEADVNQLATYDVDSQLLSEVARLLLNDLSDQILAEVLREDIQPCSVPQTLPAPTFTLVPEIPVSVTSPPTVPPFAFLPLPLPPIVVDSSRSRSKSWLPILLVALFNNCGCCGGNGYSCSCYNGCQNIPIPYPVPVPICNPVINTCTKSCKSSNTNSNCNDNSNVNILVVDNGDD